MRGWRAPLLGAVLALGLAGASGADARVPLGEDAELRDGLTLVAAGNYLRRNCDAVTPRIFRALSYAQKLHNRGRALGYSDAEIEAFLDDEDEKDKVKARAKAYLEARGVDFDEPETFCTVALAEIQDGTGVGWFLKEK